MASFRLRYIYNFFFVIEEYRNFRGYVVMVKRMYVIGLVASVLSLGGCASVEQRQYQQPNQYEQTNRYDSQHESHVATAVDMNGIDYSRYVPNATQVAARQQGEPAVKISAQGGQSQKKAGGCGGCPKPAVRGEPVKAGRRSLD